jgi:hypothetical protein
MTDSNPGGWPDAARPGCPANPERDGPCVLRGLDGAEHDVFWNARQQQYEWSPDGWLTPANATEFGWRFVKQDRLYTEAEVAALVEAAKHGQHLIDTAREWGRADDDAEGPLNYIQRVSFEQGVADALNPARSYGLAAAVEAARAEGAERTREACAAVAEAWQEKNEYQAERERVRAPYNQYPFAEMAEVAGEIAAAIRARGDAIPGEYRSEAEQERVELINRLGRVTEELRLSMDATASRIIEVIRERVDDEREACASVSVRVEVPPGAEKWSPLEAWEEALTLFDASFRAAIRARGDA